MSSGGSVRQSIGPDESVISGRWVSKNVAGSNYMRRFLHWNNFVLHSMNRKHMYIWRTICPKIAGIPVRKVGIIFFIASHCHWLPGNNYVPLVISILFKTGLELWDYIWKPFQSSFVIRKLHKHLVISSLTDLVALLALNHMDQYLHSKPTRNVYKSRQAWTFRVWA